MGVLPEVAKKTIAREIGVAENVYKKEKYELHLRQSYLMSKHANDGDMRKSRERKRMLSLRDEPLVSYPSNQKKLPQVFRSKSIHHEPGSAKKRTV
jgi:hypothetical protein